MFSFAKKISPTWYFNLRARRYRRYWANFELLGDADKSLIEKTDCYSTKNAAMLDMAYQAWAKGIIGEEKGGLETSGFKIQLTDEYRFLRRYHSLIWVLFVLFIRLIELNNPLIEIKAFLTSLKTRRVNVYAKVKNWQPQLKYFNSALLDQQPKVSVIIPTLNRYQYLKDVLADLEKQDYRNFEVLVVDQSAPYNAEFYKSFELDLTVWQQPERALWLARNRAIERSRSEYVLLFDDDSRVEPDWITSHVRCLDFFDADVSSGVSISIVGAKVPETYAYYKWGDQVDTGNVLIKKAVFRAIGLFDRQFEKQRQGDGEWGLRAYLAGFKNISNPDAKRLHLKVPEGGLREMGSWDGWRPKKFFAPRPVPSVLYLTRKYFGDRAAVYEIVKSVFPSLIPYRFKRNRKVMILGSVLALLMFPVVAVSVFKSWRLASEKLRQGALIAKIS